MGLQRVAEVDSRRHLRSASTNVLVVPPMRHSTIDDRTFLVTASRVWNSLPLAVTSLQSLSVFKRQLKTAVCPLLQLLMPHTLRCDPVFIFLIVVRCPCSCSTLHHLHCSLFTICGDACPLSCVSAETCLTGWPNARGRRDGGS